MIVDLSVKRQQLKQSRVKAYYEKLVENDKKPLQALVAVMRKLVHAIYGMLKTDSDFDGEKF